ELVRVRHYSARHRPARWRRRFGRPHHPVAEGANGALLAHELRVEPAALVFERWDERVDLAPHRDVRRRERRLYLADAIDQHLQVVQPSQNVLMTLEGSHVGG